jgi:hypothetical protein
MGERSSLRKAHPKAGLCLPKTFNNIAATNARFSRRNRGCDAEFCRVSDGSIAIRMLPVVGEPMQQHPSRQRLSCAPGMFSSLEVKVLYPT